MAGLAGVLYAHCISWIEPNTFGLWLTVMAFTFTLVGGWETMWGPVAGAIFLTLLLEVFRFAAVWRQLIYGSLTIVVLFFRPSGLLTRSTVSSVEQLFSKIRIKKSNQTLPPGRR